MPELKMASNGKLKRFDRTRSLKALKTLVAAKFKKVIQDPLYLSTQTGGHEFIIADDDDLSKV